MVLGSDQRSLITRRAALSALLGGSASLLAGCGHLSLLGYSTAPNYDPEIRSVYVPLFKCRMLETTPYRGIEFTVTRAVVDAIEARTPMKVISDPDGADTELQGTVIAVNKLLANRTPFNEQREIILYLYCEIVWHDLRPGREGKILTNPRRRDAIAPPADVPFDPNVPPKETKPDVAQPVVLNSHGRAVFELGESNSSALKMAVDRMAINVCNAMEVPW